MRRVNVHLADSTSRISFEALHATNNGPSIVSTAVPRSESRYLPGTFGASSRARRRRHGPTQRATAAEAVRRRPSLRPSSRMKWRDTLSVLVSISTSTSSIMQTE